MYMIALATGDSDDIPMFVNVMLGISTGCMAGRLPHVTTHILKDMSGWQDTVMYVMYISSALGI